MPTEDLYNAYAVERDDMSSSGVVYQDTNGVAINISDTGLDENGFINDLAFIRFYQWSPGDTSTPLTSEQILLNGGARLDFGRDHISDGGPGTGWRESVLPSGPPASDALEELLGSGGVGIFKEDILATSQYTNVTAYAVPEFDTTARLILYADVDTAGEELRVIEDTEDGAWDATQQQMQMRMVYSAEELSAIDQKYGGLPSGESTTSMIDSMLSSMAVSMLQTFNSDRLTQNKAFNKARLRYKNIVSLTNIEPTSGVNISATASEEIVEGTEFSDGFTYTSTTQTG